MSEKNGLLELHVFSSSRKFRDIYKPVLETLFDCSLENISLKYADRPDEFYSNTNDRTQKILVNSPDIDKIENISGHFLYGGDFEFSRNKLTVAVDEFNYNYEMLAAIKKLLSPIFSRWIFRNQYIWGFNLYEDYDKNHFFALSEYIFRARKLETPEVDIYRHDNGIIHKYRFFTRENYMEDFSEGLKAIDDAFSGIEQAFKRGNYEPLEVLYLYVSDKNKFRKYQPRTKVAKDIQQLISFDD
ncbi:MAG: hypothetical protein GX221_06110 [Candidatus Riflebacteria bacterium]|nr:hypothetical protein [Candidatus Riflebacteria bacterium]